MFKNGKLTIQCDMGSYIAVKDEQGNYYQGKASSVLTGDQATLTWCNGWAGGQRWALLQGTRYIIMRKAKFKEELILESVDKATYDAYQIVTYTTDVEDVRSDDVRCTKVMKDGQIRIVRGDKIYTITGQLVQ